MHNGVEVHVSNCSKKTLQSKCNLDYSLFLNKNVSELHGSKGLVTLGLLTMW